MSTEVLTVKELVEILKKAPDDTEVSFHAGGQVAEFSRTRLETITSKAGKGVHTSTKTILHVELHIPSSPYGDDH